MKIQLDLKLHTRQQEIRSIIVDSPYRIVTCAIGRQWGKSYLDRALAIEYAGVLGKNVMWVSPSIPSARSHWRELARKLEDYPHCKVNHSTKQITFKNGGIISVRSAVKPDNLRGETVDLLILDEAAFYLNGSYLFWQVCVPMITASGGKILITTTPNGRDWVFDLFKKGQAKGQDFFMSKRYPTSSSPVQNEATLEILRESMPSRTWRIEYLAEFLADGGGVFSGVERAAICEMLTAPEDGHSYVAAVDIGHNNDSSCVTILDKYTRRQVAGYRFDDMGTIAPLKRIIEILDWWQPEVTAVETNGVGKHFFTLMKEVLSGNYDDKTILEIINDSETVDDKLEEIVGGHRLRGIHVDNNKKREFVERLSADIEYGRFFILADTEAESYGNVQISEMSTFERKRTANGVNTTYGASEGTHDDTITALYLAYSLMPKHKRKSNPRKRGREKAERVNPFRSGTKSRIDNA